MLNGKNTWVVLADASSCKIYEYQYRPEKIKLIKELIHPENQLKDIDIALDKHGSFRCNAGAGNFAASDPKKNNIDAFSRKIAQGLDADRKKNQFAHLILISPPQMVGLIQHHLNKHVKKMLDINIAKDISKYNERQLLSFIHQQTHIH